jgi:hypothetical protein
VLRIATEELLRNELVIRTYDVSGVDFGLRNLGEPPQVRLSVPEQTGGRGGRPGGHGDVLQGGPQGSPEPSRTEQIEQLVEVIRLTIEPESWEPGGRGTIAPVGLTLVVRNSPGVQEEIASLLARLSR